MPSLFKKLKKARCSHRDIRGASRMVYFSTYSFSFFRFIFRMSCFLANLKSHWSSLDLIDLLILVYISLLALFIFTANRLFVGEFLDAVASLAPTRAPGSQSVGWSVRHTSRFSLFWCLLNVIDLWRSRDTNRVSKTIRCDIFSERYDHWPKVIQ